MDWEMILPRTITRQKMWVTKRMMQMNNDSCFFFQMKIHLEVKVECIYDFHTRRPLYFNKPVDGNRLRRGIWRITTLRYHQVVGASKDTLSFPTFPSRWFFDNSPHPIFLGSNQKALSTSNVEDSQMARNATVVFSEISLNSQWRWLRQSSILHSSAMFLPNHCTFFYSIVYYLQ